VIDVNSVVRVLFLKATSDKLPDLICEICGSEMVERSCKIKCPNCGFTRDCSDP
jgi:rubrerythrin